MENQTDQQIEEQMENEFEAGGIYGYGKGLSWL